MRGFLFTLTVLLVAAVPAAAAPGPIYWSVAQMSALAPQLPGPTVNLDGAAQDSYKVGTPKCVGIGTQARGGYPGFRCTVSWRRGFLHSGTAPLWVRPQAGGYCLSATGFAGCPAVFRPDDPRACGRVVETCTVRAARRATGLAIRARGELAVNLLCTFRSALVSRCEWMSGSAVITYRLGAEGWKPTVVFT